MYITIDSIRTLDDFTVSEAGSRALSRHTPRRRLSERGRHPLRSTTCYDVASALLYVTSGQNGRTPAFPGEVGEDEMPFPPGSRKD